jgi:hypothetical protein
VTTRLILFRQGHWKFLLRGSKENFQLNFIYSVATPRKRQDKAFNIIKKVNIGKMKFILLLTLLAMESSKGDDPQIQQKRKHDK